MASKTSNPALRAAATGLGNVAHRQAINVRDIQPSLAEVQTIFVARRTRLRPVFARVVAELAFGRAA